MILSYGRAVARISVRSLISSDIDANFIAGINKVDVYKGASDSEGDGCDQPSHSDISKKLESHKVSHSNPVFNGADPCTTTLQPAKFPLPPVDSLLKGTISLSTPSSSSDQHKGQRITSVSPVPTPPTDRAPPSRPPSMSDGYFQKKVISVGDIGEKEWTASVSQKYGVCQKVAIEKGAMSVVRLANKWDRSEEKLYAIKVNLDWGLFLLLIK